MNNAIGIEGKQQTKYLPIKINTADEKHKQTSKQHRAQRFLIVALISQTWCPLRLGYA